MRFSFKLSDILPESNSILYAQGVSKDIPVKEVIQQMTENVQEMFSAMARPVGLMKECSIKTFETIFVGEEKNAEENPLETIYPRADHLSLFALTMGESVSLRIQNLFKNHDYAYGAMLDTAASLAADTAVTVMETYYYDELRKKHSNMDQMSVLSYSPGYCGWDLSGQRKLFQFLEPEKISISLNDSCLMTPLKSVTGILVAGNKQIHIFKNNYPFCKNCRNPTCQERQRKILQM